MNIKSSQTLVAEALEEIKTISIDEAYEIFDPRGVLELRADQVEAIAVCTIIAVSKVVLEHTLHRVYSVQPLV